MRIHRPIHCDLQLLQFATALGGLRFRRGIRAGDADQRKGAGRRGFHGHARSTLRELGGAAQGGPSRPDCNPETIGPWLCLAP